MNTKIDCFDHCTTPVVSCSPGHLMLLSGTAFIGAAIVVACLGEQLVHCFLHVGLVSLGECGFLC